MHHGRTNSDVSRNLASRLPYFTLKTSRERIKEMFRLQRLGEFDPRYNIAPSQPILAVRVQPGGGEREGVLLKWGLILSWAKEPGIGNSLANARADTVAEKPAFRSAFKKRRCLVAADGFYEFIWTILAPLRSRGDAAHLIELNGLDPSAPP
jgi:putative SOS response-associated peptidase YedK